MGFLREQMGEEELRALLETLSVEAGAWRRGPGWRAVWACWRGGRVPPGGQAGAAAGGAPAMPCTRTAGARPDPPTPTPTPARPPAHAHSPRSPGKDGGIDVNKLMELADEAEEEEWEEGAAAADRERKE